MNTNHNRIKVSDLETDERDKILATNSKGELEFIATKNIKVDSYNALDYEQEGKALDARQGKILKDLVNNKTDKGGFQGTAQDLANSIPDLNSSNLKLGNYPSTRNDGQLSTNKVLTTDAEGNLKLCSLPTSITYPAPYITEILPNNFLPNTTANIILKGSFFTPNTNVAIENQTVNYITFKSDNEILVNVTSGNLEGNFSIILNNGLIATFPNSFLIIYGDTFSPKSTDYKDITQPIDLTINGEINVSQYNVLGTSILDPTKLKLNSLKNFHFNFSLMHSPFGTSGFDGHQQFMSIYRISDNVEVYRFSFFQLTTTYTNFLLQSGTTLNTSNYVDSGTLASGTLINFSFRKINGVITLYKNSTLLFTPPYVELTDMYIKFFIRRQDIKSIKYVELF
ncbi:IPT/TIG domain-containing protein [Flavobacterium piscisymbiosum]|uniref:IPT/TIG domain-containing protein n=1 Tax=Flavobacterium piscisymbiosum TaxID=2893753 RepID=A0ABS8MP13_9FLAO|nr:IPT/TIG domain-containing protein [Flavobacterium sp. F-30]MCC9066395.1 IPT/TIG domain-containing protein [Flavobacterium sp. F-30]